MRKAGGFFAAISVLPFLAALCFASQPEDIKSIPLKGLKGLWVLVENLPQGAQDIGLTRERIQTVTELKLRREGLIAKFDYASPYFYVAINVSGLAFNVLVSVEDWVTLERDKTILCRAKTWLTGTTGTHGRDSEYIIGGLERLIDSFLNDYYKANPKK